MKSNRISKDQHRIQMDRRREAYHLRRVTHRRPDRSIYTGKVLREIAKMAGTAGFSGRRLAVAALGNGGRFDRLRQRLVNWVFG